MHSHDRTLIAKLGFADGDKRHSEHDAACQYLISRQAATRVAETVAIHKALPAHSRRMREILDDPMVIPSHMSEAEFLGLAGDSTHRNRNVTTSRLRVTWCEAKTEVPLTKGEGKYQTTLGFLDVEIGCKLYCWFTGEQFITTMVYDTPDGKWSCGGRSKWVHKWVDLKEEFYRRFEVAVEVKIQPASLGEIVRQIKFYRSFLGDRIIAQNSDSTYGHRIYALATRYEMSQREVSILENEEIFHIHLGDGFDAWLSEQSRTSSPSTSSIKL